MVSKRKSLLIISIVIIGLCSGAAIFRNFIHNKITHYHLYHLLKHKLFSYKRYDRGNESMKFYYNREAWGSASSPKWWFRPIHLGSFNTLGLFDNNRIYLWTGSQYVYCLDAKTGKQIWRFSLPIGKSAYGILEDVNNDGIKELLIGTTMDLPIRVYCLDTQKPRILWVTNVYGDFIRRGLASCRNQSGQVRIIVATRDAPYSRGTLNVLDSRGKHLYPPIYGVDVCNNIPTIADINNDGNLEIIIGSHSFYGARYGDRVNAFAVETGKLIWSTPVGFDTGFIQLPVIDNKIIAKNKVLDAKDGRILSSKPKRKKERMKAFLILKPAPHIEFNLSGEIIERNINKPVFQIMQDYLPSQQESSDFYDNPDHISYKKAGYQDKTIEIRKPKTTKVDFKLINIDGKRYALVNYNCVLYCFDL